MGARWPGGVSLYDDGTFVDHFRVLDFINATVVRSTVGGQTDRATVTPALVTGNMPALTKTILVSAAAFMPTTTAGSTDTGKVEISAQHDYYMQDFPDNSAKVYATALITMPDGYDGSTITARFKWTVNSTSTNGVRWGCQLLGLADSTALNTALGTAQEVTDNGLGTANVATLSGATSAITPGGTAAGGNLMLIVVYRDSANAGDTLAATVRLLGVQLEFGSSYSD